MSLSLLEMYWSARLLLPCLRLFMLLSELMLINVYALEVNLSSLAIKVTVGDLLGTRYDHICKKWFFSATLWVVIIFN